MSRTGSISTGSHIFNPGSAELEDGTLWIRTRNGSVSLSFESRPGKADDQIDELAQLGHWLHEAHELVTEAIRTHNFAHERIPLATSRRLDTSYRPES